MTTTQAPFEIVASTDNRAEWLEARNTGIGASDMPTLFGLTGKSAIRLWAEKQRILEPEDLSDNEAVHWGTLLESLVAEEYERKTGRSLSHWDHLLRSLEHEWALATPDYWHKEGNSPEWVPVQIKTTGAYRLKDWKDGPPEAVRVQVHQEMLVTGASWASVGVLVGGQRFMWADVQRDESLIEQIIEKGNEFWYCIQNGVWPSFDGSEDETVAVGQMWTEVMPGEAIALPIEAIAWTDRIEELQARVSSDEQGIAALKNQIKACIGDHEKGLLPDGSGYSYKTVDRRGYYVEPNTYRQLRRIKA